MNKPLEIQLVASTVIVGALIWYLRREDKRSSVKHHTYMTVMNESFMGAWERREAASPEVYEDPGDETSDDGFDIKGL